VPRLAPLLILTFIESLSTILIERGSYFFCREHLYFSDAENLALALAFGAAYAFGALTSHWVTSRFGEKRILAIVIALQILVHGCMALAPTVAVLFIGMAMVGLLNGQKWPVVESYITAGHTPLRTGRILGYFNFSWALAVPTALVVAGPLIEPSEEESGGYVARYTCRTTTLNDPGPSWPAAWPD